MTLLKRLWREYSECSLCPLSEVRQNVVFGNGNEDAKILLIKSSPTLKEDLQGTYLTPDLRFLIQCYRKALKTQKSLDDCSEHFLENFFITSAVICRPAYSTGAFEGQDRKPKPKEVNICAKRLYTLIYSLDPHIIVACGITAIKQLKAISNTSSKARQTGDVGEMFTVLVPGVTREIAYSVIPAPCLKLAEINGDYDYEDGKVLAVTRALRTALNIVTTLESEDKF